MIAEYGCGDRPRLALLPMGLWKFYYTESDDAAVSQFGSCTIFLIAPRIGGAVNAPS